MLHYDHQRDNWEASIHFQLLWQKMALDQQWQWMKTLQVPEKKQKKKDSKLKRWHTALQSQVIIL